MRLRQIALVSNHLDEVVAELGAVFGLKVAYVDPNVGKYGLRNAVLPCGDSFLEVVEPTTDAASAARFLARRGGDAGYMVILQVADAQAERDRVARDGARVVEIIDRPNYFCAHFHPADFGGVLASFDQQRTETDHLKPFGDWMPAGPDWRAARTDQVIALASTTIAGADPDTLARLWSARIGRALAANDTLRLPLEGGAIRFAADPAERGARIAEVELKMRDSAAALARARAAGLDVQGDGVRIGGVVFRAVA